MQERGILHCCTAWAGEPHWDGYFSLWTDVCNPFPKNVVITVKRSSNMYISARGGSGDEFLWTFSKPFLGSYIVNVVKTQFQEGPTTLHFSVGTMNPLTQKPQTIVLQKNWKFFEKGSGASGHYHVNPASDFLWGKSEVHKMETKSMLERQRSQDEWVLLDQLGLGGTGWELGYLLGPWLGAAARESC